MVGSVLTSLIALCYFSRSVHEASLGEYGCRFESSLSAVLSILSDCHQQQFAKPPLNLRIASSIFAIGASSNLARRQRSRLAQTPSSTFKLLETSRRSDVLETLQLTKTVVRQAPLTAGNDETSYGTRPSLDLTLVHIVECVQILCLMHRCVALDDAHGVVFGHSFESLAHGLAQVTKSPSLRPALLAEYGAGERFGF